MPRALSHNLLHNKVLHDGVVLVNVLTEDVPYVSPAERVRVEALDFGFFRVFVRIWFQDDPDIPAALAMWGQGLAFELMESSFFLGRETLIPLKGSPLACGGAAVHRDVPQCPQRGGFFDSSQPGRRVWYPG